MLLLTISVIKLFPIAVFTISSFGSHFLIAAPRIMTERSGPTPRIQFFMVTRMPKDILVTITTPMFLKGDDSPDKSLNHDSVLKPRVVSTYDLERKYFFKQAFGRKWSYRLVGTGVFSVCVVLSKGLESLSTFQAVPVEFWGKKYIAVTLWIFPSIQIISSAENNRINTHVIGVGGEKLPSLSLNNKTFEGGYLDFVMGKWEAFSISYCDEMYGLSLTLTGTSIEGAKPIGVVSGNCETRTATTNCKNDTRYLVGATYDIVTEMLLSKEAMGTEFIAIAPKRRKTNGLLLIVAGENNTEVKVSVGPGPSVQTIKFQKEGEYKLDFVTNKNRKLVSDKRIQVAVALMSACIDDSGPESLGDLALCLIMPNVLFYSEYIWKTPASISDNVVAVVADKAQTEYIYLDHSPLPVDVVWEEVVGESNLKVGTVDVAVREHSIASTQYLKFGCYLYGLDQSVQYMHPAGFSGCSESVDLIVAGDGIDNDCDDYVHEEAPDGEDNDDDRRIDEDTYETKGTAGNWGVWSSWTCNLDCVEMVLIRTRQCDDPPPSDGGRDCLGPRREMSNTSCTAHIQCWVECHNYTWGENCARSCANCKDECNSMTGKCSSCRGGFKNRDGGCNKNCETNEYGEDCRESCTDKCGADCIDRVTGECPNVQSFQLLWLLWLVIIPIILLLYFLRRKEIKAQNEAELDQRASVSSVWS